MTLDEEAMYPIYKLLKHAHSKIRLLQIVPSERPKTPGSFDFNTEPIRCRLSHAPLRSLHGVKVAQAAGMVDLLLEASIQGPVREIAHAWLLGSQDWNGSDPRERIETLLDEWYAWLISYLPLDFEENRPIFFSMG